MLLFSPCIGYTYVDTSIEVDTNKNVPIPRYNYVGTGYILYEYVDRYEFFLGSYLLVMRFLVAVNTAQ